MSKFKIPVSAYLKKYVTKKFFQDNKAGPFKIEENTLIGKQFMSIIIDARKKDVLDRHLEHTHTIEVILSQDMMKRSPNTAKLVTINFFLDKVFKEDLISWILSARYYGIRPHQSAKDFLAFYSIDEREYSHDAAYKLWQRWKNADYKKKMGQSRPKIRSVASSDQDEYRNAA